MTDRSQTYNHNDRWVKRDTDTGRFVDQKADPKPFKGVRKEKEFVNCTGTVLKTGILRSLRSLILVQGFALCDMLYALCLFLFF
jgi:hypothetical protein